MSSNSRINKKSVLADENGQVDQYEQYLRSLESNNQKNKQIQEEVYETPAFIVKDNDKQRSDAQVRQPVSNLRKLKNITTIMNSKTSLKGSETLGELDTDELFENFDKFFKVSFDRNLELPMERDSLEQIRKSLTNLFSDKDRPQSRIKCQTSIVRDSLEIKETPIPRPGTRHGPGSNLCPTYQPAYNLKLDNYDSNVSAGQIKVEENYGDLRRLEKLPVINKRASFTNLNPLDTMKSDDYLIDNMNHLQRTRSKLEKQINSRNKSLDYKPNQPVIIANNTRKAHHKPLEDITNILNATNERKYSEFIGDSRVQRQYKEFFETNDDPYDYRNAYEQPGSDSARAYLDGRRRARNDIIQKISNDIFPKKSPRLYEGSTKTGKFIQTTKYPPKERISLRENNFNIQAKVLKIEDPNLINFRPESRKGQNSTRIANMNMNNIQPYRYNNAGAGTVTGGHGRSTSVPKGIVISRF